MIQIKFCNLPYDLPLGHAPTFPFKYVIGSIKAVLYFNKAK
jgi:hypothetical protein